MNELLGRDLIMEHNKGQISDPKIYIKPSEQFLFFISQLKVSDNYVPRYKGDIKTDERICNDVDGLLNLQDMHWIYDIIQLENEKLKSKVYFHELLEGSEIILPKNEYILRNPELERRCVKLRNEQANAIYKNMTRYSRPTLKEDTISYNIKHLNKELIVILQFVLSVLVGFAFGFIGIGEAIGSLGTERKILLGIFSALVIAIAELYFIVKMY